MFRRTTNHRVRIVCLSWTADGNSVGKALPKLGFKTYTLKTMLAQNEEGAKHPQLWDNLLRPSSEHFDAFAAAREQMPFVKKGPLVQQSRIAAQNKMAQRLGVATSEKLKLTDLAKYDAIVGVPVSAMDVASIVEFFPQYTKFVLVEETNKPEWAATYVEDGVVPVLINLRNMLGRGPTGKVWLSVFRHFAWPGSADTVFETLPKQESNSSSSSSMIQPKFITQNLKDEAANVAKAPGDMAALQERQERAVAALREFERQVKATIPAERLYIFRDGDGWAPLLHFLGKEQELISTLPPFPEQTYGVDFLDQVRFRIARTQMLTYFVNFTAIVVLLVVAYQANAVISGGVQSLYADAMKALGQRQEQQQQQEPKEH